MHACSCVRACVCGHSVPHRPHFQLTNWSWELNVLICELNAFWCILFSWLKKRSYGKSLCMLCLNCVYLSLCGEFELKKMSHIRTNLFISDQHLLRGLTIWAYCSLQSSLTEVCPLVCADQVLPVWPPFSPFQTFSFCFCVSLCWEPGKKSPDFEISPLLGSTIQFILNVCACVQSWRNEVRFILRTTTGALWFLAVSSLQSWIQVESYPCSSSPPCTRKRLLTWGGVVDRQADQQVVGSTRPGLTWKHETQTRVE